MNTVLTLGSKSVTEDSWEDLQSFLADTPMAKKYTVEQVIEIARKKKAKRLMKKYAKFI